MDELDIDPELLEADYYSQPQRAQPATEMTSKKTSPEKIQKSPKNATLEENKTSQTVLDEKQRTLVKEAKISPKVNKIAIGQSKDTALLLDDTTPSTKRKTTPTKSPKIVPGPADIQASSATKKRTAEDPIEPEPKKTSATKSSAKSGPTKTETATGFIANEHVDVNKKSYFAFKNRSGPVAPGSKEIPAGDPTCLAVCGAIITKFNRQLRRAKHLYLLVNWSPLLVRTPTILLNVMEGRFPHYMYYLTIVRRVTSAVSRKTTYVVVGNEPGKTKTDKAKDLGIPMIDEDGLFDIVRKLSTNFNPSKQEVIAQVITNVPNNSQKQMSPPSMASSDSKGKQAAASVQPVCAKTKFVSL